MILNDASVFAAGAGGYDAGIICHTRLETESIMKARVTSRAQSVRNRYVQSVTQERSQDIFLIFK